MELIEARRGRHECVRASPAEALWSRPPTRVVAVTSLSGSALAARYPVLRAQWVCALLAYFGARPSLSLLVDDVPARGVALTSRSLEQARALWSERWVDETLLLSSFEPDARAACAMGVGDGSIVEDERALRWAPGTLSAALDRWSRADRNALRSNDGGTFVASRDLRALSYGVRLSTAVAAISGGRGRTLAFCGASRSSAAGLGVVSSCEILWPSADIQWIGSPMPPAIIEPASARRMREAQPPVTDMDLDASLLRRFGRDALWLAITAWAEDELLAIAAEREPAVDALQAPSIAAASRVMMQIDSVFYRGNNDVSPVDRASREAAHERSLAVVFEPLLDRFDLGATLRRMSAWLDRVQIAAADRPVIAPAARWQTLIERALRPWSSA